MSIFPTKILLATDGSKEASLAARTAVDLADKTASELHVVFVLRTQDAPDAPTTTPWTSISRSHTRRRSSKWANACSTSR